MLFAGVSAARAATVPQDLRLEGEFQLRSSIDGGGFPVVAAWIFEPHCARGACDTAVTLADSGLEDRQVDLTFELKFDGVDYSGFWAAQMAVRPDGENALADDEPLTDDEGFARSLFADTVFQLRLRVIGGTEPAERRLELQWTAEVGPAHDGHGFVSGLPWDGQARQGEFSLRPASEGGEPENAGGSTNREHGQRRDAGGPAAQTLDPGSEATRRAAAAAHRLGRSSLATALRTPQEVSKDLGLLIANLAIAAALVLLVFPAALFNSTFEEHHDEIVGWFRRRPERRDCRPPLERTVLVLTTAFLMALVFGMVDPKFGTDRSSLLLVVGVFGALLVDVLLIGGAANRLVHRRTGEPGKLRPYPMTLIVASAAVGVSRLVHFLPGYLYGVAGGFVRESETDTKTAGRSAAFTQSLTIAVAVGAWVAWQPVSQRAQSGGALPVLVLDALLSGLAAITFQALLFSMLPIRGLPGAALLDWNKAIWAGFCGVGAFSFVHVLVHPTEAFTGSVVAALSLFAGFGIASVGFWGYFQRREAMSSGAT